MKLRPEMIEQVAERVYQSLAANPEVKIESPPSDVIFGLAQAITEDMEEEEEIEREARALLEQHAGALRTSGLGMDEAVLKTKRKIARDRKFVL